MADWPYQQPPAGTVHVGGSHGYLMVDRRTGIIIAAEHFGEPDEEEEGYHNIARFDPRPFAMFAEFDAFDILGTAYWTKGGDYAEQLVPVFEGPEPDNLTDWTELRLLPAPAS